MSIGGSMPTWPAKVLRGKMLFVDSKFDETVAAPPYEVVTNPFA